MKGTQKVKFYAGNAIVLLGMAKRAYEKAEKDRSDQDSCIVAVLLSCAAIEAYINETFMLIREMPDIAEGIERVEQFAAVLSEVETSRGSTSLKYVVARSILTGKTYDKGAQPYQDFDLLFSIRDELMHFKLETVTGEPHRLIKRLRTRKLCPATDTPSSTWMAQMATPECAKWACKTATAMIHSIQEPLYSLAENQHPASMIKLMSAIEYG